MLAGHTMRVRSALIALVIVLGISGCALLGQRTSPTGSSTAPEDIKPALSRALQRVDKEAARLAGDAATTIEPYPAPFLQRYQIYRVLHANPNQPVMFYVGFAPGQRAYLLTDEPGNYVSLARADGLVIDSPEAAATYAQTYLEVTRNMSRLFYVVSSVEQVQFRPNLTDAERKTREGFLTKYGDVITAPTAEPAGDGYSVTAYAIREQALEKHTLAVDRDGKIQDGVEVLEQDLPLVYGM